MPQIYTVIHEYLLGHPPFSYLRQDRGMYLFMAKFTQSHEILLPVIIMIPIPMMNR
jgi:hypothetical protein